MSFKIGDKVVIVRNRDENNHMYHRLKLRSVGEVIYKTYDYCYVKGLLNNGDFGDQAIFNKDLELYDDSDKYFFIEHEVSANV